MCMFSYPVSHKKKSHGYYGSWSKHQASCNLHQHGKTTSSVQGSEWCHTLWVNRQINHRDTWRVDNVEYRCRPTQLEECSSPRWSSGMTTTWERCYRYLGSTVLHDRSSWMLHWSDLLEILKNVWSGLETTGRSELWLRNQTKKLI